MNYYKFSSIVAVSATLVMFLSGCEKEKQPIEPTLGGIEFSKNPCHPGDTIIAKVIYKDCGEYTYFSEKLSKFENLPAEKIIYTYHGISSPDGAPFCTFIVKEVKGHFKVTFTGQVGNYAGSNLWGNILKTDGILQVEW